MAKKVSRAEARRLRAELLDRRERGSALPAALRLRAEQFEPRTIDSEEWARVRPLFLAIIEQTDVRGADAFSKRCIALAAYLAWASREGLDLTVESVMRPEPIDEHVRAMGGRHPATRRSHLRSLARAVNPTGMPPGAITYPRSKVRPPYTDKEMAAIERIARTQPTVAQRRGMCAVVGLGRGAGLDSCDLRYLHAGDIEDRGEDGIWVQVPGPRPRLVPVRRRCEELVRIGLDGIRADGLVIGQVQDRRNVASKIIETASIMGSAPPIEASRLRTTWLADLLTSNVPLPVVMAVSGLTTAHSIIDVLNHLDVVPDASSAQ